MRRSIGFTLIEVLVTLVLASSIVVLASTMWRVVSVRQQALDSLLAKREQFRDAVRILDDALQRAGPGAFAVGPQKIEFAARRHDSSPGVEGFYCAAEGTDAFQLEYRAAVQSGGGLRELSRATDVALVQRRLLLDGLRSCRFSFLLIPPEADAVSLWVGEWPGSTPPRTIRLDVSSERGASPPVILTTERHLP